jgi:hypothetical protein
MEPGIDSEEPIPPAYAVLQAGTTNRVVVPARPAGNRILVSLEGLQIRTLFPRSGVLLRAPTDLLNMCAVHALVEDFLDLDKLDWNLFRERLEDFIV